MCHRDRENATGGLQNIYLNLKEKSGQDDKQAISCREGESVSGSVYHTELQQTNTNTKNNPHP